MMKEILSWVLSYRVGQLRYLVAKTYIEAVSQLHRSATIVFGIIFFIALFASGVMLMTIGTAMILPLSPEGRGIIVLSAGVMFLGLSVLGYFILNSERMWMKYLGVASTLKEISGENA